VRRVDLPAADSTRRAFLWTDGHQNRAGAAQLVRPRGSGQMPRLRKFSLRKLAVVSNPLLTTSRHGWTCGEQSIPVTPLVPQQSGCSRGKRLIPVRLRILANLIGLLKLIVKGTDVTIIAGNNQREFSWSLLRLRITYVACAPMNAAR